jgi:hypothetical protein
MMRLPGDVLAEHPDVWQSSEALRWQNLSAETGIENEIERVIDLNQDELGLDAISYDPNGPLAWTWVDGLVWNPFAASEIGRPAANADDEPQVQGWFPTLIKVGVRLAPFWRGVEIAAAAVTIGKEIYNVSQGRYKVGTPMDRPTDRFILERRAKIHYTVVRERYERDQTPRGTFYRHYRTRTEYWANRF